MLLYRCLGGTGRKQQCNYLVHVDVQGARPSSAPLQQLPEGSGSPVTSSAGHYAAETLKITITTTSYFANEKPELAAIVTISVSETWEVLQALGSPKSRRLLQLVGSPDKPV